MNEDVGDPDSSKNIDVVDPNSSVNKDLDSSVIKMLIQIAL